MLIPKFPSTFTHKHRTLTFAVASIVSITVSIIIANFMSDSIVQTIMWIVFSLLTLFFISLTVYSGIKAYIMNE